MRLMDFDERGELMCFSPPMEKKGSTDRLGEQEEMLFDG